MTYQMLRYRVVVLMHMNYGRPLINPPVAKNITYSLPCLLTQFLQIQFHWHCRKKRPEIPPKPVLGLIKESTKGDCSLWTTGLMMAVTRTLFKGVESSSIDSDDVLFCDSPELDNNWNVDLTSRSNVTLKMVEHHEVTGTERVHRVTHSISKQMQKLHKDLQ